MKTKEYDIVIVGAGAAGCAAAIYSSRRNLKTLLLELKGVGGLFLDASWIENYPGFERISGVELAEKFKSQVKKLPIDLVLGEVQSIKKNEEGFEIKTTKENFSAKSVVVAAGTRPKELGLKDEKRFSGLGVSYCATCDGPLFRGKEVAVVGGGNSAIQYTLFLSEICSKVYLINREKEFNAEDIVLEKVKSQKNVEIKTLYNITELFGKKFLEGIKIKNSENGKEGTLEVSGVFVTIGHETKLDFLKDLKVELGEKNTIKINEKMETNVPGLFAAGDVTGTAGQIIIACGQGAKAALNAASYLKEK
ncbi:MAG: FAD-dependent oxidoreductase [Candidatus Pacearchaeota archaeon]|nr:FAD-dependent oxidoreductase [Candidatus Pacearchaeota archaeon]